MNEWVYIVLVNWNSWADTLECLESLCRIKDEQVKIVIVDNSSSDGSLELIQQWANGSLEILASSRVLPASHGSPPCPKPVQIAIHEADQEIKENEARIVVLCNSVNAGFAGGCNTGIRYALARNDASFVWLLNNDTVIDPGALNALLKRMAERPDCGMCGSTLLFHDRPDRVQAYGGGRYLTALGLAIHVGFMQHYTTPPHPWLVERAMNYVVGASLFVRRRFLDEIGLLNEEYFLFFEEVDWAFRSRGRHTLAYAPDSIVYHKVGRSIGTSSNPLKKSDLCDYYTLRNRIRFTRTYAPWALPSVYLVIALGVLLRLCLGRYDQALTALRIMLGKASHLEDSGRL